MNIRAMSELVCLTGGHELNPITYEPVNEIITSTQTWTNNNLPKAEETKEVLYNVCKRSKITIITYTLPEFKESITNNYYTITNNDNKDDYTSSYTITNQYNKDYYN